MGMISWKNWKKREETNTLALSLWPNKSKIFLSPVHPPRNEENEKEKIGTAVDSAAQWSDSVTLLSQKFICVGEECKENTRQLKEKEMKMIRMIKRFFGGKIPLKELGEQRKLRRYFFPFERGERKI